MTTAPDHDPAVRNDQDPDPAATAGLEAGGGIRPGDTPADSGSMSGGLGKRGPNDGPVSGNRTPMVIALSVLVLVVLMSAVAIVAQLIPS